MIAKELDNIELGDLQALDEFMTAFAKIERLSSNNTSQEHRTASGRSSSRT